MNWQTHLQIISRVTVKCQWSRSNVSVQCLLSVSIVSVSIRELKILYHIAKLGHLYQCARQVPDRCQIGVRQVPERTKKESGTNIPGKLLDKSRCTRKVSEKCRGSIRKVYISLEIEFILLFIYYFTHPSLFPHYIQLFQWFSQLQILAFEVDQIGRLQFQTHFNFNSRKLI